MKILTKEDEQQFYNATVKGGTVGGVVGLAAGMAGVWAAGKRYPAFRSLTLPFRTFLAVSCGSFSAIIAADRSGRSYEKSQHPDAEYQDARRSVIEQLEANQTTSERAMSWASENRYSIVFASWVASMGTAFAIVGRSPYLSTPQKLVQARVYAQGLTLAVVVASLALETGDSKFAKGKTEAAPSTTEVLKAKKRLSESDQWMDMIEAEEERMKQRGQKVRNP